MVYIFLLLFVLIVVFYFIAKLIVNHVPHKLFPLISIVLLLISGFLGYLIVDSIVGDIKFNNEKVKRYQVAVDGLKLIRDAELAYKNVKGDYTNDFTKLINFIENDSFPLLRTLEKTKQVTDRGVAREIEFKILDTIGYQRVKLDFEGKDYKNMMYVPGTSMKYELKTGYVIKGVNKYKAPVFEAKIAKTAILEGLREDLLKKELQIVGVDEINGESIIVGTLEDVKETGNWPPSYDKRKSSILEFYEGDHGLAGAVSDG